MQFDRSPPDGASRYTSVRKRTDGLAGGKEMESFSNCTIGQKSLEDEHCCDVADAQKLRSIGGKPPEAKAITLHGPPDAREMYLTVGSKGPRSD